ncbi:hypothetical protein NK6_9484 [Bradyrhizobium diazoefficiens]|uniref:Uncharacterized protein n=1 Tax=Bradyrhizobium diazoefficiens TaxID=1355477 RepID=A0A0E4BXI6_9BRAD|nr:hypothetical protein NK6_9484 [Bradyrhizobium diazoefficiens]
MEAASPRSCTCLTPDLSQNCDRSAPPSLLSGLTGNASRIIVGASRDQRRIAQTANIGSDQ